MEKKLNNHDTLIITHIGDTDGMGSAILGKIAFGNIDYILISPNEQKEALEIIKETNYDKYYICDIGIDSAVGDEIASLNKKILIFDHHKTHNYVNKYPFAKVEEFYNGRKTCGTELFYIYLLENNLIKETRALNEFVELIRSYDTWDWTIDNNLLANDLNLLLSILGTEEFINTFSESLVTQQSFEFNKEQRLMIDLREKEILSYIDICNNNFMIIEIEGFKAGVLFSEQFSSRVGNYLCLNNDIDFAMLIDMVYNTVSLRSTKDGVDVGTIAKSLGGGGHLHSAGFPLNNEKKLFLLNKITEYLANKKDL